MIFFHAEREVYQLLRGTDKTASGKKENICINYTKSALFSVWSWRERETVAKFSGR
jgi:hypothetical protein